MATKLVNHVVGIYGAGVVAGGVVTQLRSKAAEFAELGVSFTVKTICCRDVSKTRDFEIDEATTLTADVDAILQDSDITMVVEVMGGTDLAKHVVFESIAKGKHVVTANKALLASHLHEIIAHTNVFPDSRLAFEAAVGGGIPCIRTFQTALLSDKFVEVAGILNGTTNFMLSAMESDGVDYDDILKLAQEKGFAEADPTADVGGYDAQAKITLLAKLAFGLSVDVSEVPTTGITQITSQDFSVASDLGCTIKLLGIARPAGDRLAVFVSPTLVPKEHPIGRVSGATNIVQATTEFLGSSSYVSAGAGRFPTSNSVVADMLSIAVGTVAIPTFPRVTSRYTALADDYDAKWYLRFATDTPAEATKVVTSVAAEGDISIESLRVIPGSSDTSRTVVVTTDSTALSAIQSFSSALSGVTSSDPFFLPFL